MQGQGCRAIIAELINFLYFQLQDHSTFGCTFAEGTGLGCIPRSFISDSWDQPCCTCGIQPRYDRIRLTKIDDSDGDGNIAQTGQCKNCTQLRINRILLVFMLSVAAARCA